MTEIANTAQSEAWNGYEGEHWAGNYDRYDAVNHGYNEPLLTAARVAEGDRILDIGCGNGQLTRVAARRTGSGSATGVDLSGPMLARARALAAAEGVPNVSFEQGDVQAYPFPGNTFDVAMSRSTAGFRDIAVEYREAEGIWGRDIPDATDFIMGWGPIHYHRTLARFATDDQVRQAISSAVTPHVTPDGVSLRVAAWLVTATTPLP